MKSEYSNLEALLPSQLAVAAWGNSFEKLIEDSAGLQIFAEFLKKEFSAENIYFWAACERYKHIQENSDRAANAMAIFSKHLAIGAPEPVNIDSQGRTVAEANLHSADLNLFNDAQKQIFNLMKFDSYQRFIRSDLYEKCLEAAGKSKPLPYLDKDLDELLKTNFCTTNSLKLKKSVSNAEDRRQRSLLPWHRKTRCNSRDRVDLVKPPSTPKFHLSSNLYKTSSDNYASDTNSSRSSLYSFDKLPLLGPTTLDITPCSLCRVILSDGATTIVQTRVGESIGQLVERLLEKRGLTYQYYDVVLNGSNKSVDLNRSAHNLAGKEVLIEQRVTFKLDLPDPKVISVKSKPKKPLYEVIKPILEKYNYSLEKVKVLMRETQELLDLSLPVTSVNEKRVQVIRIKNECDEQRNQTEKFPDKLRVSCMSTGLTNNTPGAASLYKLPLMR